MAIGLSSNINSVNGQKLNGKNDLALTNSVDSNTQEEPALRTLDERPGCRFVEIRRFGIGEAIPGLWLGARVLVDECSGHG